MLGLIMMIYKIMVMRNSSKKRLDFTLFMVFILAVFTFAAGIMSEAYVNVTILPGVLKKMP